jgi:hypothetical protein
VTTYPKVKAVQVLTGKRLRVTFPDRQVRLYDCTSLLDQDAFRLLRDDAFFKNVSVDPNGYGIAWTDSVDLAEPELWLHGAPEEPASARSD